MYICSPTCNFLSYPTEPPAEPRKVEIQNLDKTSCTIAWKAPEFDGGSPITGYYVERQTSFSPRWIKVNKTPTANTSLKIKDLVELNEYNFRVIAENDAGLSEPSQATGKIIAKNPYDKPGQPGMPEISEVTGDSLLLTWTKPRDSGNTELTNYIVEMRAVGDRMWQVANDRVTKPSCKVSGLRKGVQYEFRVSAVNKVGQGAVTESVLSPKLGEYLTWPW